MTERIVVDTNVLVVANSRDTDVNARCSLACIEELERIRQSCQLVIDDSDLILEEYRKYSNLSGEPGDGDKFLKWIWDYRWHDERIKQVTITPHPVREFEEFPDDPRLEQFDRSDRKFVAVARATDSFTRIVNATDRKSWWRYREELQDLGVIPTFTCPEMMKGGD